MFLVWVLPELAVVLILGLLLGLLLGLVSVWVWRVLGLGLRAVLEPPRFLGVGVVLPVPVVPVLPRCLGEGVEQVWQRHEHLLHRREHRGHLLHRRGHLLHRREHLWHLWHRVRFRVAVAYSFRLI
jgi:hypothetical protein